jgi:hypothetical protein
MKTRNGFVSNSSSTSFLIYGVHLKHEEFNSALKLMGIPEYDFEKLLYGDDYRLEIQSSEYDGIYIGVSWDKVGDEQTGKQFKESIAKKIKSIFPNVRCDTWEKAWYDG